MSVRQACPSWQATLPPAALGEERQVNVEACGTSKIAANANTSAVVARELMLSCCFHMFWMTLLPHSAPPRSLHPSPHCSQRLPKSPFLLPLTTNQHDCRRPTVLLRRVPSPHPPLKSPICSAMPCRARTTVHGQGAQVSGKPGEVRRSGAPCLRRPPTPV